jgi:sulfur carrier protein ThiS
MTRQEVHSKPKRITVEIDGEEFELDDREMTVAELLALVELDPADSYLIELHGQGNRQVKHEDPNESIKLHKGQRFISGDRAPAPVA